jgi:alkanesulfonate monooxygenase SsuD/methylene tetrahydromethanopterin reductase-like flavin-dependent oxidoreductase (luciferase family)
MGSADTDRLLTFARRAESLGFDGLFGFDHFFPPATPPDAPSLESYASLAAVAAVTERVTVGTLVTRASLRSLGILAKQAASLDDISDGRFVLAIGTGDAASKQEHEVFDMPYLGPTVRVDHLVETVRGLRALFRGEGWAGGDHVPATAGPILPAPRTEGGPPIWIGGASERAIAAAAAEADGWNGWGLDEDAFVAKLARLRELGGRDVLATWAGVAVVGRDAAEAERVADGRRDKGVVAGDFAGDPSSAAAWLDRLHRAGAAWAIVLAAGGADRMELIGEHVLPRLAAPA